MNNKILVTGGTGYIGSHIVTELINNNYNPVLIDNLSNSKINVLKGIKKITNQSPVFYKCDVRDKKLLDNIMEKERPYAVIHLAGVKAVGESVVKPLKYYDNNVSGFLTLTDSMDRFEINKIVFSSSATVYGKDAQSPYKEDMKSTECTSPYAWSKLMIEQILKDKAKSDKNFSSICLRYFNPIGAHPSGFIGEDPNDIPNNLMPYILQVAAGRLPYLNVYGNDYNTIDGTGVRDYIHVMDLARGHVLAMNYLKNFKGNEVFNLGAGKGYSVLEVVSAFEKANNILIPYKFTKRREGDLPAYYADIQRAVSILNWSPIYSMYSMCKDAWKYYENNLKKY